MGVLLQSHSNPDIFLKLNWWNWRPIVAAISMSDIVDDEVVELLSFNSGVEINGATARAISTYLLNQMPKIEGDLNLDISGNWHTGPVPEPAARIQDETIEDAYRTTRLAITRFVGFCETSGGFTLN